MADIEQDPQESQKQAAEKQEIPEAVLSEQEKQRKEAADERGKFLRQMEQHKDFAKKYGEPDLQHLMTKIGSDGNFAQLIVQDLLNGESTFAVGLSPDAPQEHNVTGKLDHTGDVATRVKPATEVPVAS